MTGFDTSCYPRLRTIKDWQSQTHRPVIIIGNGPSAFDVSTRRLPLDPVIVRMNAFMFEPEYSFGDRVDGIFWAIGRRWLQVALALSHERKDYHYGTFFTPPKVLDSGLSTFHAENAWIKQRLGSEVTSHFDILLAHERLNEWFLPRNKRKRPGLPTQGVQALGAMLCLGFRDVYIAGMDFYQNTKSSGRYAFSYPDFIINMTAPAHTTAGYEEKSHSIQIDLAFMHELRLAFPDANLFSLSPSSFLSEIVPVAPLRDVERPIEILNGRTKDHVSFIQALREKLIRPYEADDALVGAIERNKGPRLHFWCWTPLDSEPGKRRDIEILRDGELVDTIRCDKDSFEQELSCIGDARHGAFKKFDDLFATSPGAHYLFRDKETGETLKNGDFDRFSLSRTDLHRRSILLRGSAPLDVNEEKYIENLSPVTKMMDVSLLGDDISQHPTAEKIEKVSEELALEWAVSETDKGINLVGFQLFKDQVNGLLALAHRRPNLILNLIKKMTAGLITTACPGYGVSISQVETLMKQVVLIYSLPVKSTSLDEAGSDNSVQALAAAMPQAIRLNLALWEMNGSHISKNTEPHTPILVDLASLLQAPARIAEDVIKGLAKTKGRIVVSAEHLPFNLIVGLPDTLITDRLKSLADTGAYFVCSDIELARSLQIFTRLPHDRLKIADRCATWDADSLDLKKGSSVLAVVDSLAPETLQNWKKSLRKLNAVQEGDLTFRVVTPSAFFRNDQPLLEATGLVWGGGIPDTAAIKDFDLVWLSAASIGRSPVLPILEKAVDTTDVYVIASEGACQMSKLPQSATWNTRSEAARAINDAVSLGIALPVGVAPSLSDDSVWADARYLLELACPDMLIPSEELFHRSFGLSRDVVEGSSVGAKLDINIALTGRPNSKDGQIQVNLVNYSPHWIPQFDNQKGGAEIQVELTRHTPNNAYILKKPVTNDIPPYGKTTLPFDWPTDDTLGVMDVAVSVLLNGRRKLCRRQFSNLTFR